jgi:hypothetical protein
MDNALSQEEQRTMLSSMRADQERREAIHAAEIIEEPIRAAIFTKKCNVEETSKSYM